MPHNPLEIQKSQFFSPYKVVRSDETVIARKNKYGINELNLFTGPWHGPCEAIQAISFRIRP
jgi:Cu2+-containing amine oxidase